VAASFFSWSGLVFAQVNPVFMQQAEDGIPMMRLPDVVIQAKLNPKERRSILYKAEKFNRLRYNVYKVYPYARYAAGVMDTVEAELALISGKKQRKMYCNLQEKRLFGRYEKEMRDLTVSQGRVLFKLIDRETGSTTYTLLKELKGPTSAFMWQCVARVFGNNLKVEYDPEEDALIEEIVLQLENEWSHSTVSR